MIKYFITKVKVEKTLWVKPKNWVIIYISKKEPKQTFYCKINWVKLHSSIYAKAQKFTLKAL